MIFCCFPPQEKCEWANLIGFVQKYNDTYGKSYVRTACPDVEDNNSKQPEVLLEAEGEIPIVIERKTIVWPRDYFSDHANEHDFRKTFWAAMDEEFDDALYELTVQAAFLQGKTKKQVKEDAERIASILKPESTEARCDCAVAGQDGTGARRAGRITGSWFRQ